MSRIKLYFALESDRERKAFIIVSETATVEDAIQQLHDQNIVKEVWKEERVEFVGILPRSHLLQEDYKRDMAIVPMHNSISDSYVADDIVLVRRAVPSVVDLCVSEDNSIGGSNDKGDEEERSEPCSSGGSDSDRNDTQSPPQIEQEEGKEDEVCRDMGSSSGEEDRRPSKEHRISEQEKQPQGGEKNTTKAKTYQDRKKYDQDRKKYGKPLSKHNLPRPSVPGGEPISEHQYRRRVYTCLGGDTPKTIADKFGYDGPDELVYHNRGIYSTKATKLEADLQIKSGSIFLLPLRRSDFSDDGQDKGGSAGSQRPRKRQTPPSGEESAKKRAAESPSNAALARRNRKRELEMYVKRISTDGLPVSCHIKGSNPPPFDNALPGSLVPEEGRYDRRVYVCRGGETPLDIASKQGVYSPNPAGRIVFDNRMKHKGIKTDTPMKQGAILVLPPIQNGPHRANSDSTPSLPPSARRSGAPRQPHNLESSTIRSTAASSATASAKVTVKKEKKEAQRKNLG